MFRKLKCPTMVKIYKSLLAIPSLLATLLFPFGLTVLYNEFLNKNGQLSLFFPIC